MIVSSKGNRFNETILSCFKDVIAQHGFTVKQHEKFSRIEMWNDECFLRFIYDFGDLSIDFIDPKEKAAREKVKRKDGFPSGYPVYPVFSVWKFLYPNDPEDFRATQTDLRSRALADKRLILTRFNNVLHGDFSWAAAYKANDRRISAKVEYMCTHWAMDNPVRVKFNGGDPAWEKAFDEYKSYLDKLQGQ